ncbi:MAG: rhodanese-like domain-containing protein [Planctomycetota bacterium]
MRLIILAAVLVCANLSAGSATAATYAKPELLASQESLTTLWRRGAPVVVLDVRSRAEFDTLHIPTARHVDIFEWKAAFGDGTDAAAWSRQIGDLGIDARTTVIVYDRFTSPSATRAWWLLKYWGVADVRVLDGGWLSWTPRPLDPMPEQRPPTEFLAQPQPERLATLREVEAIAGDQTDVCLVDTRTNQEWNAGIIPTASHSDWINYVDPETAKLRRPDELLSLLAAAGYDPQRPAVTYCRSGGRASLVAFVMELMGGQPAANYWGSWNEWSGVRDEGSGVGGQGSSAGPEPITNPIPNP